MKDRMAPYRLSITSSRGLDQERIVFVPAEDDDGAANAEEELDRWFRTDFSHVDSAIGHVERLDSGGGEALAAAMDGLEAAQARFERETGWLMPIIVGRNDAPFAHAAADLIRGPQLRPPSGACEDESSLPFLFRRAIELRRSIDACRNVMRRPDDPLDRVRVCIERTPDGYLARLVEGTQHHVDLGDGGSTSRFQWHGEDDTWLGVFCTLDLAVRAIAKDVSGRTDLPECGRWTVEVDASGP